jgi:maltodextrin utilization protein YvdJ
MYKHGLVQTIIGILICLEKFLLLLFTSIFLGIISRYDIQSFSSFAAKKTYLFTNESLLERLVLIKDFVFICKHYNDKLIRRNK